MQRNINNVVYFPYARLMDKQMEHSAREIAAKLNGEPLTLSRTLFDFTAVYSDSSLRQDLEMIMMDFLERIIERIEQ